MLIKYMFNILKEGICLYDRTEKIGEAPFGGMENIPTVTRLHKEYCDSILEDIESKIQGLTECKYCGCIERIGREVYQIKINENEYEVAFVFDKRNENNVQLHIEINSQNIENENLEIQYDKSLEALKIALKNRLIKDWELCTWLIDEQSEILCSDLYHRVFKIENQVRAFSNKVLIQHLGQNWLEQPGFEKYRESVLSMETSFKQIVPQFANINTSLLSMTLETLSKIILKAAVYKENTMLSSMDIIKLYSFLDKRNDEAVKNFIEKKRQKKIRIWEDIFIQYFDEPDEFKKRLTQFIKSRNHIAHNKLLTFSVFEQVHSELTAFESTITNALNSFERRNPSEELLDTWIYEHEQEEFDPEYEEKYWRERISSEACIEIRDEDEIYDLFCETVMNFCEELSDKYHFDSCFEVSDTEFPAEDGYTKVCTITSNASDEKLDIIVSMAIDEEMDATSTLLIEAKHGEKTVDNAECTYYNGTGHEGEEGLCVADYDSEYDDSKMKDFIENVINYIDEDLNPYLKQLSSLEYECGRYGGPDPVAYFACEECGNNGVSILEDFLPIGKCCYCGYENEYYTCELCGMIYDELGGDRHLCNGCMPKDKD